MRSFLHRLPAVGGLLLFLVPKLHLGTHLPAEPKPREGWPAEPKPREGWPAEPKPREGWPAEPQLREGWSSKLRFAAGLLFFALFGTALIGAQSYRPHAATIIVTNTNDSGPGSLRQALADVPDGGTVQFDPPLNGQTITLTAELAIDKNITITGPGSTLLTVFRSHEASAFRIFHVMPGHNAVIGGLTIYGGLANGGGGVLNDHAILTIDNCLIQGNSAFQDQTGKGGGIYNDGSAGSATLTILNSTVMGNYTGAAGGGIYNSDGATLHLTGSHVNENSAAWIKHLVGAKGSGGGIANDGTLIITASTISSNSAGLTSISPGGSGGGISSEGTFTITNSTITGNVVGGAGGGLIVGGTATITNTMIVGNRAYGDADGFLVGAGGGIVTVTAGNVTIANSTLRANTAARAAGAIGNDGTMTVIDTTIAQNSAESGGGIHCDDGTLELRNSTVSGNSASGRPTSYGGGIYNTYHGAIVVSNCTITGNDAGTYGAAISNEGTNTSLTVTNSTINDNPADVNGGGIYNHAGHVALGNTILKTGTSGSNILNDGGTVTSLGYNLSSDNGGGVLTGPSDQINTDPLLGPLQDNGGPTFTHDLLAGSPAINAGDPNFTPPPSTDQRGYPRVYNGRIDIGSVEVQPKPTPTPSPTATTTATPTASPSPTPLTAHLLNISTRMRVGFGENVMIAGFIITGNAPKTVAVRGLGPSLGVFGIPDLLVDPTLELHDPSGTLLMQNDNWQDDPAQAAQLTALGLALQNTHESGLVTTLAPAPYYVILAGNNNGTGVGLLEVYDVNSAAGSQLAEIATRGFVQTGDNVMIGGFILNGSANNATIAVRGLGPTLQGFGVPNALPDPILELHNSNGMLLVSNDNWQDDPASAAQLTAYGLALVNPFESGLFTSLPPGLYTAILAGNNAGIGVGLVEVYNVQ